jgi:hypothetical protein
VNYAEIKYPKGYPLEHIVGDNCPDGIQSVAEGITATFENMVRSFKPWADLGIVPSLPDRGVPQHNVLARLSAADFKAFYETVCAAAKVARAALDETDLTKSVEGWRSLFGNRFPAPPAVKSNDRGGFSEREQSTDLPRGRFA